MGWKKFGIKIKGIFAISIVALLLIIILAGWFYWYEWRPSQIRKECSSEIGVLYEHCLHQKGIAK